MVKHKNTVESLTILFCLFILGLQHACNSGQYYNSGQQICENCTLGCQNCLGQDDCSQCQNSYFSNQYNGCSPCSNICSACTTFSTCSSCQDRFYLIHGTCLRCSSNCIQCLDSSSCQQCSTGFDISLQCSSCITGYYYNSTNMCSQCIQGCSACITNGSCISCNYDYTYISGLCIGRTTVNSELVVTIICSIAAGIIVIIVIIYYLVTRIGKNRTPDSDRYSNPKDLDSSSKIKIVQSQWIRSDKNMLDSQKKCIICLQSELNLQLDCSHSYHLQCIDLWMKKRMECPLCKIKITKDFKIICSRCTQNYRKIENRSDLESLVSERIICPDCIQNGLFYESQEA